MPDEVLRKAAQDLALAVEFVLDCAGDCGDVCDEHYKPLHAALKEMYAALDPWPAEEAPNADA